MAEKLDRLRQLAQRLRDRVHWPQLQSSSRDKVDQIITKYVPANKVTEIAERLKNDAFTKRVKELVSKYEKFTGVEEIMALQNTVVDAQERFMQAQERRRDLGRQLASIESRLKELHAEMQNTMKGDEKYLHLCTEEHKLIIQERALRQLFMEAEREERELFASMSAAVKLGHERERAHAERNKYWYIVASILGTLLGIAGSTINNRLKMAEFREMMEQQMARSASVLYTIAGGNTASEVSEAMKTEFTYQPAIEEGTSHKDLVKALKSELAYQAKMAENLKIMQDTINHLVNKQASVIDHLNHQSSVLETKLSELKRAVITASQSSAKSDAELAKAFSVVHQDLDDEKLEKLEKLENIQPPKVSVEPNQVLTAIGILVCTAIIFGNVIGRVS